MSKFRTISSSCSEIFQLPSTFFGVALFQQCGPNIGTAEDVLKFKSIPDISTVASRAMGTLLLFWRKILCGDSSQRWGKFTGKIYLSPPGLDCPPPKKKKFSLRYCLICNAIWVSVAVLCIYYIIHRSQNIDSSILSDGSAYATYTLFETKATSLRLLRQFHWWK